MILDKGLSMVRLFCCSKRGFQLLRLLPIRLRLILLKARDFRFGCFFPKSEILARNLLDVWRQLIEMLPKIRQRA